MWVIDWSVLPKDTPTTNPVDLNLRNGRPKMCNVVKHYMMWFYGFKLRTTRCICKTPMPPQLPFFFSKTVTLTDDLDLDRWPWTWDQQKVLVTMYTCEIWRPYLLPIKSYGQCLSFFFFFCGQTNGQTEKRTGQKLYAPDLSMRGHKRVIIFTTYCESISNSKYIHIRLRIHQPFSRTTFLISFKIIWK